MQIRYQLINFKMRNFDSAQYTHFQNSNVLLNRCRTFEYLYARPLINDREYGVTFSLSEILI